MILGWESVFNYMQLWFKPNIDLEIVKAIWSIFPFLIFINIKQTKEAKNQTGLKKKSSTGIWTMYHLLLYMHTVQ